MIMKSIEMYRGRIMGPTVNGRTPPPGAISSINVNGIISDNEKQLKIRNVITGNNAIPPCAVGAFQDIKHSNNRDGTLSDEECRQLADSINPGGRSWWTTYCGLTLHPHHDNIEVTVRSTLDGRVMEMETPDFRLINNYAPPQPGERRIFYTQLTEILTPGENVVMVGDWNVVPNPDCSFDWHGGRDGKRNIGGEECQELLKMMHRDGLSELKTALHHRRSYADFTHISASHNGTRRHRRFDWFAVSPPLIPRCGNLRTHPLWVSDHAMVSVEVQPHDHDDVPAITQRRTLPTELLECGDFYHKVAEQIRQTTKDTEDANADEIADAVDALLTHITEIGVTHVRNLRRQRNAITKDLLKEYNSLTTNHQDPSNWDEKLYQTRTTLDRKIAERIETAAREERITADADFTCNAQKDTQLYKSVQDVHTPTVFSSQKIFKPDPQPEHPIHRIRNPKLQESLRRGPGWEEPRLKAEFVGVPDDGTGHTSTPDGMSANAKNFYTDLYRFKRIHKGCQRMILEHYPKENRIPQHILRQLAALVTVEEVIDAINGLQQNKACGPDAIPPELYKHNAELWAPLLQRLYNAMFQRGYGNKHMIDGLIALLRKNGDPRDLANVRGITLCNKVTNILAELMKRRLRPALPTTMLPDQCSSVPGRYMHESIFRVMDALELAEREQLALICMLADAKKAFDLIDRDFIRTVLIIVAGGDPDDELTECDHQGQLTEIGAFLRWIDILLGTPAHPLERRVLVNGTPGEPIHPHSGTPQGLEVSAQIFNIAGEGLMGLLRYAKVVGVTLNPRRRSGADPNIMPPPRPVGLPEIPRAVHWFASRFADDVITLVRLVHMDDVLDMQDVFCAGSTQATNIDKTVAFGVGAYAKTPAPFEPAGRLVFLLPGKARGKCLGIEVGPDANIDGQWAKTTTKMFTKMRRWSQHELSYWGRASALSTWTWSLAWFLGSFRPPAPKLLQTCTAATRQFIWNGAITSGTTPLSSSRAFHHGARHNVERLHNPGVNGGIGWPAPEVSFAAIHAMWIVHLLSPHRANNKPSDLAMAFDIAADTIANRFEITIAEDGDVMTQVAEFLLLSGILTMANLSRMKRQSIPSNWWTFLKAWAQVRAHLQIPTPTTFEQVLAAPIFCDARIQHGLRPMERLHWSRHGVTHVRHLWDREAGNWRVWLHDRTESAHRIHSAIPAPWRRILASGPTPIKAGHWIIVKPGTVPRPGIPGIGQLARVHSNLTATICSVNMFAPVPCGGWRADSMCAIPTDAAIHATVEGECPATDRTGPVHWLTGPTDLTFFASRTSTTMMAPHTVLSKIRQRHIRAMLSDTTAMCESAVDTAAALTARNVPLAHCFHTIRTAPWTSTVRNFAYDLASGALPCGQAIKHNNTSACLICAGQRAGKQRRDSVAHMLTECPYLQPLRTLLATLWLALKWPAPPPTFASFLAYGVAARHSHQVATTAVRGALLYAARWARCRVTDDSDRTPATAEAIANQAKKWMRNHITIDYHVAVVGGHQPVAIPRRHSTTPLRPENRAQFRQRWGAVCTLKSGATCASDTCHVIEFHVALQSVKPMSTTGAGALTSPKK